MLKSWLPAMTGTVKMKKAKKENTIKQTILFLAISSPPESS
jgi:hypothetical protein